MSHNSQYSFVGYGVFWPCMLDGGFLYGTIVGYGFQWFWNHTCWIDMGEHFARAWRENHFVHGSSYIRTFKFTATASNFIVKQKVVQLNSSRIVSGLLNNGKAFEAS